ELVFVNLPPRATIRIYSLGGILVDVVDHDDQTGGGRAPWDLRNRSGQLVASGVYFWHVVTPQGDEHVGKFTIVNPHRE
ncbi:MAG: T9SS C-terminal target domain-containing protein, partial [Gemmatimonadota bacterium]